MSRCWRSAALLLFLLGCGPSVKTQPPQDDAGTVTTTDAGTVVRCRPECSSTKTCVDGQCVDKQCNDPEETICGAICVDLATTPTHCGTCGTKCGASWPLCSGGQCGNMCGSEFCPVTSLCLQGHCCAAGSSWCTDRCVDVRTDLANCGGCGLICSANSHGTAECATGQCMLTCNAPYVICQQQCINYADDPLNCGECGRTCATGDSCVAGKCARTVVQCSIQADGDWQDCSGLHLNRNETYTMRATGMWTPSGDRGPNGPTGSTQPIGSLDIPYDPMYSIGALLWRENDNSRTMAFTMDTMSSATLEGGDLRFRMNSLEFHGQSGALSVTVEVYR